MGRHRGTSGRWEATRQNRVDRGDVLDLAWLHEELGEALWPQHVDSADGEGPSDQGPVGVDEGERTPDRRVEALGNEGLGHERDLLGDAVDELGAVAATNKQSFHTRPQNPAFHTQGRASLVALGVDDPDAVAGDRDVVDVGAGAHDAAIVQDRDAV